MERRFIDNKVRYRIVPASKWAKLKTVIPDESGAPEMELWCENDDIKFIRQAHGIFINDAFLELWDYDGSLLFLDGAYGSSKTTYAITRLLVKCMSQPKFNCFYGRAVYAKAAQLHENIIEEIKRNGWEAYFDYSIKPNGTKQIFYKGLGESSIGYGNKFNMFGCDEDESIKGWNNPTDILLDEVNQIEFSTFGMLYTRLRTPGVKTQFIGCFNNCDVRDGHWIKDYIYGVGDGQTENDARLLKSLKRSRIRTHHSIYTDNLFQNPAMYYDKLVTKAGGDERLIEAYCNGGWGIELNAQPYYKFFSELEHKRYVGYDPKLALAFIFDENVNPYFPTLVAQRCGNEFRFIDEICGKNPYNTLEWVTAEFTRRYEGHACELEIYGDATSKKEDVSKEKGQNLFTMAAAYLKDFDPVIRVSDKNPNNSVRQRFINLIFKQQYGGLSIVVSPKCVNLLRDLKHVMEDGKKENAGHKDKSRKMVDGVRSVQELGHLGDCLDYFICESEINMFQRFQYGGATYAISSGGRMVRNSQEPTYIPPQEEEIEEYVPSRIITKNRMQ